MQHPYILTESTFTVFVDGTPYATDRTNPAWEQIKVEINKDFADTERLVALVRPITVVEEAVEELQDISVRNGAVYYGEERVHDNLAKRILDILNQGINLDPWVRFAQNVYANPSIVARQELYDWLEVSTLPLTSDGHFLAYKIVRNDYKDLYKGQFDNSVGQVVKLPGGRADVDPDRNRTCSYGLHFCSKGYLPHYGTRSGSRVMIVKVNPKNVVAIPSDYGNAKGRTHEYEVVGELPREEAEQYVWTNAVEYQYDPVEWDDYEEDYDPYYDDPDYIRF
jgi:hypothetical protein